MIYRTTKKFGHELGLSCCFRQWRAESHCRLLHGYSLAIDVTVSSIELNVQNWCYDFGAFKELKTWLQETFDHKLLVAEDDPHLDELCGLMGLDAAYAIILPDGVGCEAFAKLIFNKAKELVCDSRVTLESVVVREHGANSASYSIQ